MAVQALREVFQNEELTTTILSHLDSMQDIGFCSAVSKCWHAAVDRMVPISLIIPGSNARLTYRSTDGALRWLQRKQVQGFFQNLHSLSLLLKASERGFGSGSDNSLAAFGLAVIAFAGLWPLTACKIDGPFKLQQLAELLPSTLRFLHVTVDCKRDPHFGWGDIIPLSIFQPLTELQSLHVAVDPPDGDHTFELDTVCPNLEHFHLTPCQCDFNLGPLANLLPNVSHVALTVHVKDAQNYIRLPHVKYLGLVLLNEPQLDIQVRAVVEDNSHLRQLLLLTATGVDVDICFRKQDLLYECRGVSSVGDVWCIRNEGASGMQYILPWGFEPLVMSQY